MPSSSRSLSRRALRVKRRRVRFSGAKVIEYDATVAPVVHSCGIALGSDDRQLECKARGLEGHEDHLLSLYVQELQQVLCIQGFQPMGSDLLVLQTQHQVVELLLVWAACAKIDIDKDTDVLHSATLQRAQLEKKQLEGLVDDGYAFGRRFMSVATYVETLSRKELVEAAKERDMELPKLDEQQKVAVKVIDRELLGLYDTAQGRPLRSLTLRQLVTEAEARGMSGPGEQAKDNKGKKNKRAWVNMLRPVMVAEVRALKIQELEEKMLREKIVEKMEREQKREQQQRVVQLIKALMQRTADTNDSCAEPEDDDTILHEKDNEVCDKKSRRRHEMHTFLTALAKTVCIFNESEEDLTMME
ncbi:unnamed protein product [Peronospora belbahrii]|uniref:Uncharacterized protein n=1 Tax=Peronospora belbahrii TaxID=622444 RepID=A0ABN8D965_9STRA|nr:unnamed protein product [Peronospora belbahrii]